jgi:hypothetical protein
MPTPTYTALANITLGGPSASVTFASIPSSYRDLVIVFNGGVISGDHNLVVAFNSDTTSGNYTGRSMSGTGSAASTSGVVRLLNDFGYLQANQAVIITQIMDYSATDKHKMYLSRSNNAANGVAGLGARWANTAAITSIALTSGANFATGTTFSLYGVIA